MDAVVLEGMEDEIEEEDEVEGEGEYVKTEEREYSDTSKDREMAAIMERLKQREKKQKAANLVSKLKGKKKVNKKIMPYEIYATSGE